MFENANENDDDPYNDKNDSDEQQNHKEIVLDLENKQTDKQLDAEVIEKYFEESDQQKDKEFVDDEDSDERQEEDSDEDFADKQEEDNK